MQPRQAFARARLMFSLIASAIEHFANDHGKLAQAFELIGPYRSRGKGQGGRSQGSSSRCVAHDKRDAKKARNQARHKRAVRGAKR